MEIYNIEIEEKTDLSIRFVYRDDTTNLPIDVTGCHAILEIRPQFGSNFVLDTLKDGDSTIVLGGVQGTVDLVFVPADTDQEGLLSGWSRGSYDLILIEVGGKRVKLAKGFITIARSATFGTSP